MGGPPKRTSRHPRIQPSAINLVLYLGLGSCALRLTCRISSARPCSGRSPLPRLAEPGPSGRL